MRVGFDTQVLSSKSSARRGIGRYSLNMLNSLRNRDALDMSCFAGRVPIQRDYQGCTVTLPFREPLKNWQNHLLSKVSLTAAELDIFHVLSPMEHWEDAVQMFRDVPTHIPLVSTLYDLIPLIFEKRYLADESTRLWYMDSLEVYRRSDIVLAISESAKLDAERYLSLDPSKVVALPPCGSELANVSPIHPNIKTPYFLSVLGMDERKNLRGLLGAVSSLPKSLVKEFSFVVVCETKGEEMGELIKLASSFGVQDSFVFTGYVSDAELAGLYANARAMVFPSHYEGLGLPLIEAMHFGCPVAASNTSSLPEIVGDSGILFDPNDLESIADAVTKLAYDDQERSRLSQEALERSRQFSWSRVSAAVMEVYSSTAKTPLRKKISIGIVSPWPPAKSGVADFADSLAQHLQTWCEVERIGPDNVTDIQRLDAILYQLGNSEYHDFMWPLLGQYPGIVEFHDLFLHGYWYHNSVVTRQDPQRYLEEMEYSHGNVGRDYAQNVLNGVVSPSNEKFMVNRRATSVARQVIVHSHWAAKRLLRNGVPLSVPVHTIPLAVSNQLSNPIVDVVEPRLLGVFGHIASTKQPMLIIDAFDKVIAGSRFSDLDLLFVGEIDPSIEQEFNLAIRQRGLGGRVRVTGYVSSYEFDRLIVSVSLVINLRYPYLGESSASLARVLAKGRPTITTDIGAFGEVPNTAVVKVPENIDGTELATIIQESLKPEVIRSISRGAIEYAQTLTWNKIAHSYMTILYLSTQTDAIRNVLSHEDGLARDLSVAALVGRVWTDTLATVKPWCSTKCGAL